MPSLGRGKKNESDQCASHMKNSSAQSLPHDRPNDATIGSHELEQEDTQIYEAFARPNELEGGHAHAVETCDEGGAL
jgi:hypothetical protein